MEEYPIDLVDHHVILRVQERRVLLDTGSPISFGESSPLRLTGTDYALSARHPHATIAQIAEQVGTPLDALVGVDILGGLNFVVDWRRRTITFSRAPWDFEGPLFPLEAVAGVPILAVGIGGRIVRVFVDTGAKRSYLAPSFLAGHPVIGESPDFHPAFGPFSTPLHSVPVSVGDLNLDVQFGILPPRAHATLLGGRADGILGSDLLRAFKVYFALPQSQIGLAAH